VRVLDLYDARQLQFPEVFVVGLNEGIFPQARHVDAFYDDEARAQLNREGTVLEERLPRQSEEAALFVGALAAAQRRLWLSWSTCDADGGPLLCSHFLEEVQRLFAPALEAQIRRLSEVIPAPTEAACARELLESALLRGAMPDAAHAASLRVLQDVAPQVLAHAQRCAAVEAERDSFQPPGAWDGMIGDPALQAWLAAEFGPDHHFSPSSLGAYGTCPMRFFCARVLGLQELEEPTEEVTARDLGEMLHRILAQFFAGRTRGQDAHGPLSKAELPAEQERMAQIVRRVFAEREGVVPHPQLWEVIREQAAQDMAAVLELEAEDGKRAPWAVEQVYGRDGSFRVTHGGESILLEGRIDRIDVLLGEGVRFVVLDYKSSDGQGPQAVKDGTDFQLPAYALAAQEKVFEGHGAECAGWAYYRVRHPVGIKNGVGELGSSRNKLTVEELLEAARGHMIAHVRNIREGRFPPLPAGDVCGFCPFRWACRRDPHRMARKLGAREVAP
jgi:ATP-dependent helicase/DNAse subunit B